MVIYEKGRNASKEIKYDITCSDTVDQGRGQCEMFAINIFKL